MPTLVAIGAHFDDVELRCGGTLARYVARGWNVVYAVVTNTPFYFPREEEKDTGEYLSNQEVTELRKEESRKGAAALGITDVNFFDFKSLHWFRPGTLEMRYLDGHQSTTGEFEYLNEKLPGREFIVTASRCPEAVDFLCRFLTEKSADVVLTHFPDDAHWEHYATAVFVHRAVSRLAGEGKKVDLYAWEQGGEGNLTASFAPTNFVDISETMDLKCRALMSFVSQFPDHDPSMFAERARKKAREYGALVGMKYAEPFMKFLVSIPSQMEVNLPATYDVKKAKRGLPE